MKSNTKLSKEQDIKEPHCSKPIVAVYVRNFSYSDASFEEQREELKRIANEADYQVISSPKHGCEIPDQELNC